MPLRDRCCSGRRELPANEFQVDSSLRKRLGKRNLVVAVERQQSVVSRSGQEGEDLVPWRHTVGYTEPIGTPVPLTARCQVGRRRCPLAFFGHANGKLKGGLHLKAPDGTPMANPMLTAMHMLGLDDASFGDSTGEFALND